MSKKLIIIGAAAVLLLGGGAGGAYFAGMLDPLLGKGHHEEDAEAKAKAEELEKAQESIYVELEPMMAPVIVGGKVKQQVMLTLSLQVKDVAAKNDVVRVIPKLRDAMLRELFDTPIIRNGGDGTIDLVSIKTRLLTVAHNLLNPEQVQDVLVVRASRMS